MFSVPPPNPAAPVLSAVERPTMAKALFGHVGVTDPRREAELAVLRRQVRDLQGEVLRLRAENDALAAAASPTELLTLDVTDVTSGTPVLA